MSHKVSHKPVRHAANRSHAKRPEGGAPAEGMEKYPIRKGDSLWKIAAQVWGRKRADEGARLLAQANGIEIQANGFALIRAGKTLNIPVWGSTPGPDTGKPPGQPGTGDGFDGGPTGANGQPGGVTGAPPDANAALGQAVAQYEEMKQQYGLVMQELEKTKPEDKAKYGQLQELKKMLEANLGALEAHIQKLQGAQGGSNGPAPTAQPDPAAVKPGTEPQPDPAAVKPGAEPQPDPAAVKPGAEPQPDPAAVKPGAEPQPQPGLKPNEAGATGKPNAPTAEQVRLDTADRVLGTLVVGVKKGPQEAERAFEKVKAALAKLPPQEVLNVLAVANDMLAKASPEGKSLAAQVSPYVEKLAKPLLEKLAPPAPKP